MSKNSLVYNFKKYQATCAYKSFKQLLFILFIGKVIFFITTLQKSMDTSNWEDVSLKTGKQCWTCAKCCADFGTSLNTEVFQAHG